MAGIGDWLPSVVDGVLGLFGLGNSAKNRESEEKINQSNLDYAKAMTEKQWERDDNAYQRSVADAQKAGFSPLAVLDGGMSGNSGAMAYQGQAPQFDLTSMLSSISAMSNKLQENHMQEKMTKDEIKKINEQFKNEVEILEKTATQTETQAEKDFVRSLKLLEESNRFNMETNQYQDTVKQAEELGALNFAYSSDMSKVQKENAQTIDDFMIYMSKYENTTKESSDKEKAGASMPGVEANIELEDKTSTKSLEYLQYAQQYWQDHIIYIYKPEYNSKYKD